MGGGGVGLAQACSHIQLISACLQDSWTQGSEVGRWSKCLSEQALTFRDSIVIVCIFSYVCGGGGLDIDICLPYKHLCIWETCINTTGTSWGHWLSHVKMSSGKVSLSSSHLPPSTSHHSLSPLLLSPSLTPARRLFCVCLSPGIPIEDLLRTVARWWPPD